MGGILSGNPNCKTHESTERFLSLDSYQFNTALNSGKLPIKCGNDTFIITVDSEKVTLIFHISGEPENTEQTLYFDTVPNNYGGIRGYFLCPFCGERIRKVYLYKGLFQCRRCAKLNYPSQQVTKGMDAAALKMEKAVMAICPEAAKMSPHDLTYLHPDKPKGMHYDTYYRRLKVFYQARNAYHAEFIKACGVILARSP